MRHKILIFLVTAIFGWLLSVSAVLAQDVSGSGVLGITGEYLEDGGAVMYVILLISIIGFMIFLERAFDLYIQRRL